MPTPPKWSQATSYLTLLAAVISGVRQRATLAPERARRPKWRHGGSTPVPRQTVLVVDPSDETLEVLRTALARQGAEILSARRAEQGLDMASPPPSDRHSVGRGQRCGLVLGNLRPSTTSNRSGTTLRCWFWAQLGGVIVCPRASLWRNPIITDRWSVKSNCC